MPLFERYFAQRTWNIEASEHNHDRKTGDSINKKVPEEVRSPVHKQICSADKLDVLCFAHSLCHKKNGERSDEKPKPKQHEQCNVKANSVGL
jgi:hypothetical protein